MEGPRRTNNQTVIDNGSFGTPQGPVSKPDASHNKPLVRPSSTSMTTRCCSQPPLPEKHPRTSSTGLPLTVDVEERMYAAGRIPGSFFRRGGRPVRMQSSLADSSTVRCAPASSGSA